MLVSRGFCCCLRIDLLFNKIIIKTMTELKYLSLILFAFFVIFTIKDLFVQSDTNTKEIPVTTMGSANKYLGPTLKFQYCYSCGYAKAYHDYSNILHEKYPEISIEGENYNPPGMNSLLAKVVSIGKFLIILCILGGINIFQSIGLVEPSWWKWCVENKLYSCMMAFFLSNALEGHLISTGAFEITFNDVPVWSKLETGRIPQPPELFQIIDNHLQFQNKVQLKPGYTKWYEIKKV